MLLDADRSLAAWLAGVLPGGVSVRFDAPGPSWPAAARPPLIGAFLYDVREDSQARHGSWTDMRDSEGQVVGRRAPVRRYRLSYLLTAWSAGPAAEGHGLPPAGHEHELLGRILTAVTAGPALPADCLHGSLADTGEVTRLECAVGGQIQLAGLWSGFGIAPRTCLDLVLTAPVVPELITGLAPPPSEIGLGVARGSPGPGAPAPAGSGRPRRRITEPPPDRLTPAGEPRPAGQEPAAVPGGSPLARRRS